MPGQFGGLAVVIQMWPEEGNSPIVVRSYEGRNYEDLIESFHRDAELMLAEGYEPVGQHYLDGEWGLGRIVISTLLIPLAVGILAWALMLVMHPVGTLTVTYIDRGDPQGTPAVDKPDGATLD